MTAGVETSAVPTIDDFRPLVLRALVDGQTHRLREIYAAVSDLAGLDAGARSELLASGQPRAENRIAWACSSLTHAAAIERPSRATYRITDSGRALLDRFPHTMSEKELVGQPAWDAYQASLAEKKSRPKGDNGASVKVVERPQTPEEAIEAAVTENDTDVAADLLGRLRTQAPDFFEQVVLDVLVAMGYGGTQGRATRLGRSGDGGVDGVIEQDALGLQTIYVQAKRYGESNAVGRPELQGFVGALTEREAERGVFLTTSVFTNGAKEYAHAMRRRMVTIDGPRLAALMIKYRVGVQARRSYALVEVDEDYFE